MTPWQEFTEENINKIPTDVLGVFNLSRSGANVAYVGRADHNLRDSLREFLTKGYTEFQWVQVPWIKEAFEMQCRLFHHNGSTRKLDNLDHPFPPEGKIWKCQMSATSPAMCEL